MGPIDRATTGGGRIVCTDDFAAGRLVPGDFQQLCARLGVEATISEVDGASLFCDIIRLEAA